MKKTRQRTRKQLPVSSSMMVPVEPLTPNQEKIFEAYDAGKHMFIYGCAGTGKTFTCLYKALTIALDQHQHTKEFIWCVLL
jgi:phosphate starvation-inducible protein PhoH